MLQSAVQTLFFLRTEISTPSLKLIHLNMRQPTCRTFLRDHLRLIRMLRSPSYKKLHLRNICRITGPTYYEGRLLPQHEARSLSQWGYHAGFANYLKQAVTGKSRKRMPGEQRFVKRLEAARAILVAKAIRQRQTQKGWLHLTTHNTLHDMDGDLNNTTF